MQPTLSPRFNELSPSGRSRRTLATFALATSVSLLIGGCGASPSTTASSSATGKKVQIGIAQIVSHPSLDMINKGFKDGMAAAGYVEGVNVVYDEQNPQGDQGSLTSIANNFKNGNKDLLVAIATPTAQSFAQVITDKPIIFAGITDPVAAKLVDSWEKPGGNLTGTSDNPPIEQQLQLVKQLKPNAKTLGIVYASSEVNAEVQMKLAKEAAEKMGLTVRTAAVTNSAEVQQAANSLRGVDAFYVGNDNTVVSGVEGLVQAAEQMKAVVVTADPDSVVRGASAAYAVDQYKMGYNAAKMAVQVLKDGKKPADIPVQKQRDNIENLQLTVNPAAAARQGGEVPAELKAKANKVVS